MLQLCFAFGKAGIVTEKYTECILKVCLKLWMEPVRGNQNLDTYLPTFILNYNMVP